MYFDNEIIGLKTHMLNGNSNCGIIQHKVDKQGYRISKGFSKLIKPT